MPFMFCQHSYVPVYAQGRQHQGRAGVAERDAKRCPGGVSCCCFYVLPVFSEATLNVYACKQVSKFRVKRAQLRAILNEAKKCCWRVCFASLCCSCSDLFCTFFWTCQGATRREPRPCREDASCHGASLRRGRTQGLESSGSA